MTCCVAQCSSPVSVYLFSCEFQSIYQIILSNHEWYSIVIPARISQHWIATIQLGSGITCSHCYNSSCMKSMYVYITPQVIHLLVEMVHHIQCILLSMFYQKLKSANIMICLSSLRWLGPSTPHIGACPWNCFRHYKFPTQLVNLPNAGWVSEGFNHMISFYNCSYPLKARSGQTNNFV